MTFAPDRVLLRTRRLSTIVNGRPMTQIDVCRKIKIPQSTYSAIERGLMRPDTATDKKLRKMFDLPKGYFTDEDDTLIDEECTSEAN